MVKITILCVLILYSFIDFGSGRSQNDESNSIITEYNYVPFSDTPSGHKQYSYSYKTTNNIEVSQRGTYDKSRKILTVTGSYSYVDPDGQLQTVSYIADEYGYRIVKEEPREFDVAQRISPHFMASLQGGGLG